MVTKTLSQWLRRATAVMFFVSPAIAWSIDNKPHIVVNFDVKAPAFERNLPQREAAEESIGAKLAAQIAQRLAFADWTVTPRADEARLGSLILRLEEDANTVPNPRILVTWYGASGTDTSHAKKLALPDIEIYEPTNPNWDTNSRRNFETRVLDKLNDAIRADDFYDELFKQFVRNLPISASVVAQSSDRAIGVPVRWRDVLIAPESVVIVRFSKRVGTTPEVGSLRLSPVAQRIVDDPNTHSSLTLLRGAVSAATFGIQTLTLVSNWNDTLPELLKDAEVKCYLVEYKPVEFVGTGDGIVLDPGL